MLYRFILDLAIPEAVFNSIPAARKIAFRNEVRALKALAVKINNGSAMEEMTVRATYHKCYHDQPELNKPCEPEVEI